MIPPPPPPPPPPQKSPRRTSRGVEVTEVGGVQQEKVYFPLGIASVLPGVSRQSAARISDQNAGPPPQPGFLFDRHILEPLLPRYIPRPSRTSIAYLVLVLVHVHVLVLQAPDTPESYLPCYYYHCCCCCQKKVIKKAFIIQKRLHTSLHHLHLLLHHHHLSFPSVCHLARLRQAALLLFLYASNLHFYRYRSYRGRSECAHVST